MSKITDQIKERLDIVEVIGSYIKLDKAGINFKAKCPFHNEKSPSFFVSPSRQSFYCFGCQAGGDVFSFIEKFEGVDFRGALHSLADKAGIEIPRDAWKNEPREGVNERLFEIMERATEIFEENFASAHREKEYLAGRGISDESVKKWRVGLAKDEWRSLFEKLKQNGFSKEEMLEAGLIKKVPEESAPKSSGQERYYDTFRNRIIFPIFDASGRVIAFSGRAIREDERTPKYLNSQETPLFKKSEVLYGLNFAKESIRKNDYTVLVEGQMDLLMSVQSGIKNAVASSGTALTLEHLRKLHKLSNRVIIAYDGDQSGINAAERASQIALTLGMEVKVAVMPDGEDPASVARKNPESLKEMLRNAEQFTDFVINRAYGENKGKNLSKYFLSKVLPIALLFKSDMEMSEFISKISRKIGIPEESVWSDLKKIKSQEKFIPDDAKNFTIDESPEKSLTAIIFFLEDKNKSNEAVELRKKWAQLSGDKTVHDTIQNFSEQKEPMIFRFEALQPEEKALEIGEEVLSRIELNVLRRKMSELSKELDGAKVARDREKKESEISRISKRINDLTAIYK
jgi:DNA primase